MATKEKVKRWLQDKKPYINIKAIEALAGLPPRTLEHFVNDRRDIKEEYVEALDKTLKDLRYQ